MKQLFPLVVLVGIIMCVMYASFACNHSQANSTYKKADTSRVLVLYKDSGRRFRADVVYRIIRDTVKFIAVDANTQKKSVGADTLYFVPEIDTLRDDKGKVLRDSTGKAKVRTIFPQWRSEAILKDGGSVEEILKQ